MSAAIAATSVYGGWNEFITGLHIRMSAAIAASSNASHARAHGAIRFLRRRSESQRHDVSTAADSLTIDSMIDRAIGTHLRILNVPCAESLCSLAITSTTGAPPSSSSPIVSVRIPFGIYTPYHTRITR